MVLVVFPLKLAHMFALCTTRYYEEAESHAQQWPPAPAGSPSRRPNDDIKRSITSTAISGKSSCQHIGSKLFQLASSNSTDGRMVRASPRTKGARSCQWSADKLKLRILSFYPLHLFPHQDLSQAPLRQWPGSPVKWYINARTWRTKTAKSIAASRCITKPLPHLVLDPKIHSHHIQATARNEPQACCTSIHQPKDGIMRWQYDLHELLTAAPRPQNMTKCSEHKMPWRE